MFIHTNLYSFINGMVKGSVVPTDFFLECNNFRCFLISQNCVSHSAEYWFWKEPQESWCEPLGIVLSVLYYWHCCVRLGKSKEGKGCLCHVEICISGYYIKFKMINFVNCKHAHNSMSPSPWMAFWNMFIIPWSGNKNMWKWPLIGGNVSNRGCDRHTSSPWTTTL